MKLWLICAAILITLYVAQASGPVRISPCPGALCAEGSTMTRLTKREQEQVAQIMATIAEIRATAKDSSRRIGALEKVARQKTNEEA